MLHRMVMFVLAGSFALSPVYGQTLFRERKIVVKNAEGVEIVRGDSLEEVCYLLAARQREAYRATSALLVGGITVSIPSGWALAQLPPEESIAVARYMQGNESSFIDAAFRQWRYGCVAMLCTVSLACIPLALKLGMQQECDYFNTLKDSLQVEEEYSTVTCDPTGDGVSVRMRTTIYPYAEDSFECELVRGCLKRYSWTTWLWAGMKALKAS